MRVYAVSDMHGNLEGLDPSGCDIVVIAGDFAKQTGFGKWHLHGQKKWIQNKFINWINQHPDVEFIIVPGNHDLCLDSKKTTACSDLSWRIDWPTNAHLLINSGIDVKGLRIYGSPNIPIISYTWAFESEHDELVREFSKIPEGLDILVTHSPLHIPDSNVDRSMQYGGTYAFGSVELSQVVFDKKPKFLFCGHIHSGSHEKQEFETCSIYNVSRVDESYEIAYEPMIIDI